MWKRRTKQKQCLEDEGLQLFLAFEDRPCITTCPLTHKTFFGRNKSFLVSKYMESCILLERGKRLNFDEEIKN